MQATNGVFIQKTNHGGGSAIIRGLMGNQSLILIDGIRLNNSTFRYGPNQYLNTIDPFLIDHIEIAKGTGSVQYGSDAMGGVIHILSRDPAFAVGNAAWHGLALGKYTTSDMDKTGRVELSHASKRLVISGGFTYRNFGDLVGGDITGRQVPSGYNEIGFNGKAKVLLSKNIQLTFAHQTTSQKDVPIYHKVVLVKFMINQFDLQRRQLTYGRINMHNDLKLLNQIEFTASLQNTVEGRESRKRLSNLMSYEKDLVRTLGFTLDVVLNFSKSLSSNTGVCTPTKLIVIGTRLTTSERVCQSAVYIPMERHIITFPYIHYIISSTRDLPQMQAYALIPFQLV